MTSRADELVDAVRRLAGAIGATAPSNLVCDLVCDLVRDLVCDLVRELAHRCGWGARDVRAPLLPSGVRHGVPWGVSTAITPNGTRELRVFVEAQCDPPSLDGYWTTALALTEWIGSQGADLSRFRALVGDAPRALIDAAGRRLRLWHAVAFAPDSPPRWHVYLCTPPTREHAADGELATSTLHLAGDNDLSTSHRAGGGELATSALRRLGVTELPALRARDRITIVSLDLTAAMRVKAYVLMPDASVDELAALHDRAANSVPGDAQRFGRAMLGGDRQIWWLAALGFGPAGYETCALHFGVPRHADEPTVRDRIRALLAEYDLAATPWERATTSLGAHHFVTFQRRDGLPRVTTYFLPSVRR